VLASPEALILAAVVVFAGYVVFGVTGFGASPITIPVLAQVLPLTFVLPLAAVLDLSSALALGVHTRRQADPRELVTLVPFTLLGLALGVTLLVRLPRNATLLALGLFVCGYAIDLVRRRGTTPHLSCRWAAPAGLAGGCLLPVAWSGVWLGNRVHVRLAPTTTGRVLAAVLFLTGAALILRALYPPGALDVGSPVADK